MSAPLKAAEAILHIAVQMSSATMPASDGQLRLTWRRVPLLRDSARALGKTLPHRTTPHLVRSGCRLMPHSGTDDILREH
jgi:hypothetical protein